MMDQELLFIGTLFTLFAIFGAVIFLTRKKHHKE